MPTFNPIYFFKKTITDFFKNKKYSTYHGSTINASKTKFKIIFLGRNANIPSNFFFYLKKIT